MAQTKRERIKARWGRRRSNELLTGFQVADALGVSAWVLVKWRRKGNGPPFLRMERNIVRYPNRDLAAWVRTRLNRSGKLEG